MKVLSLKVFLVFSLLLPARLLSQNNSTKDLNYSIHFIESISSESDLGAQKSWFDDIWDFVIGENEIHLIQPINLIKNSNNLLILDQALQSVVSINIDEKEFEIIDNASKYGNNFSAVAICEFQSGKFLFTDSYLDKIFLLDSDKNKVEIFREDLDLEHPTGILFNKDKDEIWVSETQNHRLKVFDSNGNYLRSIGRRGNKNLEFNFPTFIHYSNGKIYVVDAMNFRIQILNSAGNFITAFGQPGDASGYFASIKGLATDSHERIYVVDGLFNAVQVFDSEGNLLSYFGSKGNDEGKFILPVGIFIDIYDKIYVADSYNSRIQIFQIRKNG